MWRSVFRDSDAAPASFLVTLNAIYNITYIYRYHTCPCVCIIPHRYIYIHDIHVDTMPWCNLPIFCFQEHPSYGLSRTARITVAPPTTSRAASVNRHHEPKIGCSAFNLPISTNIILSLPSFSPDTCEKSHVSVLSLCWSTRNATLLWHWKPEA